MDYGCIGEKLGHSFSAGIHALLGDYRYELKEIPRDGFDAFMKEKDFMGINVTIPYKVAVIPYLDAIDKNAENIGAVNTVVKKNGRLIGYNTDFYGMKAMMAEAEIDVRGKNVAVFGTGGTSKTACAVCKSLDAANIFVFSRGNFENGAMPYDSLYSMRYKINIIINTTPAGMFPRCSGMAFDIGIFTELEGVIDAVYNPLRTDLVLKAEKMGVKSCGGLYMLVSQAAKSAELFFPGEKYTGKINGIYRHIRAQKRNIVLIGMPSSGKTTVGKIIADITGKDFRDSDEEFVGEYGVRIPEFFEKYGEREFRAKESGIIQKLSLYEGKVIATGGGAVLDEENTNALRRNGITVFLDRDPRKLELSDSRPLARTVHDIEHLYRHRYPIYKASADVHIRVTESADKTAEKVVSVLENG